MTTTLSEIEEVRKSFMSFMQCADMLQTHRKTPPALLAQGMFLALIEMSVGIVDTEPAALDLICEMIEEHRGHPRLIR